ncbi:MAG: hypothetical protein LCH61_01020 [Proteobacteria bacterium]|nr:hypothetical protein [Pseudomonadota bacterium]
MKSDLIDITVTKRHETTAAVQVHDGDKLAWLPKSQIEIEETGDGKTVIVTLPQWLAEEKGLV